ncbi:MAG: ATP synthase F0 subunit C [Candidatus Omnitrophica bacterium]|nr:ATP synthase F0 subunit C [Candidatus Omnitrophota bacterium]MBI3020833.1 ATP synthase F0 subunit C [Candidatus Omnitrophota bacterium]MBI3083780.1 ATP synthase F0 subunit C [Candidatus Omnitrophota bacterium]
MQNVMVILVLLLSTLGPAAVIGIVGYAAVKAVARNPSASPRILLSMIVAFLFAEAIAILALLMVYILFK